MHRALVASVVTVAGLMAACGQSTDTTTPSSPSSSKPAAAVDGKRLVNADARTDQWVSHGRTYAEERFVPLDQINAENVDQLGLAWSFELDIPRGTEATPLLIDGVMYATGAFSIVYALDARSGKLLWSYDPKVPKAAAGRGCCGPVNRGVAAWRGKLFVGAYDGRLIALDAKDGKELWSVMTVDPDRNYTVTGAPRVIDGKVIIGNGGAELGVRGYVSAYDADSGEQLWRFYTVPGNPADGPESEALEMARKTWHGDTYFEQGGGGTVWDSMAYDPELDLLYIGVGNGSPWNIKYRSEGKGDNLFLSSIVALRPDTGEYVWHFQTTPGDSWDYTATQHIILADLEIEGQQRKVLMQAPKNGFFFVIDRETGEFISGNNYVPVNWASGLDPETGRPQVTETADYSTEPKLITPGPVGGHNWHPMSFNPQTGLVYIPALVTANLYADGPTPQVALNLWNVGTAPIDLPDDPDALGAIGQTTKGMLLAWDPVKQEAAWSQDLVSPWNGGTLSTAGNLVFQGAADGRFAAYAADTGELLWQSPTNSGVVAAPISYELDGEQYVTVLSGWGGVYALAFSALQPQVRVPAEARVLTYKLGGKAKLPEAKLEPLPLPQPPKVTATTEQLAMGRELYHGVCAVCHGVAAISSPLVPDLRYMSAQTHEDFHNIVSGARAVQGMPPFGHLLPPEQIELIRQYLAKLSHDLVARDAAQ